MSNLPDMNLFMLCNKVNPKAFSSLPEGYSIRSLKPSELEIWKSLPFDGYYPDEYKLFMTEYFDRVYANKDEDFFSKCKVVVNKNDEIVSTCFLWKSYNNVTTLHWLKTIKSYEGKGLGRALLSYILSNADKKDFPILLHTQPESFKAIKLYSDFGFALLINKNIGARENHLNQALNYLKENIRKEDFEKLVFIKAPEKLLSKIPQDKENEF